jgi:outer membrane immunogenic protein
MCRESFPFRICRLKATTGSKSIGYCRPGRVKLPHSPSRFDFIVTMLAVEYRRSELVAIKLWSRSLAGLPGAVGDVIDWGLDTMKSHWLTAAVVGVVTHMTAVGAFAADLPPAPVYTKAPVYAPAPSWTGFYIGGDIGGAWTSNTGTWTTLPPAALSAFPNTGSNGGSSLIGGFHVGYNWQFAPTWVVGIEGDWSWTKAGGSFTQPWNGIGPPPGPVAGSLTVMSSQLDWVSSLRARLGYLVMPSLLAYGTGGVAWSKIDYSGSSFSGGVLGSTGYSAAISDTQTGYAVGGGLEWAMTNGWFVRGEYLFYHFNSAPSVVVAPVTTGLAALGPQIPSSFSWSSTNVSVGRMSLSYKF